MLSSVTAEAEPTVSPSIANDATTGATKAIFAMRRSVLRFSASTVSSVASTEDFSAMMEAPRGQCVIRGVLDDNAEASKKPRCCIGGVPERTTSSFNSESRGGAIALRSDGDLSARRCGARGETLLELEI